MIRGNKKTKTKTPANKQNSTPQPNLKNPLKTLLSYFGASFQLDPSLCAFQYQFHSTKVNPSCHRYQLLQKYHHQKYWPTFFMLLHFWFTWLILYLEILWVAVAMRFFASYLKMPSIFLYLQNERQGCTILICMHRNGPNPKENRSLKRLSLLSTLRIRSTRS